MNKQGYFMSRITKLFKNLRYISKIDLRKNHILDFTAEELLINTLYYIPDSCVPRPNVLNEEKTIDLLCKTKQSLARFGDGEISIINGKNIPFQKYDEKLAKRLREILLNTNNKLLIGINHRYFFPHYDPNANEINRDFALFSMPKYRKDLISYLDFSTKYCDAGFTGIRAIKNKKNDNLFKKVRTIWNKHDIILVGCREAHSKIKYDLFDNATKQTWIYVPNKDAFDEYDNILTQIKKHPKKSIIILLAGPTSKVLADDLSHCGYRALDLGHMAKSYNYYMQNTVFTNDLEKDFWKPDL